MKLPVKIEKGNVAGFDTVKMKINLEYETTITPSLEGDNSAAAEQIEVQKLNRLLKSKLGITDWKHSLRDLLLLTQEKEPNQAKIAENIIGLIREIDEFELVGIEDTEDEEQQ